jgi:phospholipid/cholesterol/gamma-HCH transport system permease protein
MARTTTASPPHPAASALARTDGGALVIELAGRWRLSEGAPPANVLVNLLGRQPDLHEVRLENSGLEAWDSSLLLAIRRLQTAVDTRHLRLDLDRLPEAVRRLLAMSGTAAVPPAARRRPRPVVEPLGHATLAALAGFGEAVEFLGEVALALGALVLGRARWRKVDFWREMQSAGAEALPIVGVVSLLMGLTFAFIGAVQLRQFGAAIYVADLVGLAVSRELAALMTAIVLAGRTGAGFAAHIAAMQGNEEIDALVTLGIRPAEFLVLPRILALTLMMPLLFVYSCLIGLAGGMIVGTTMLNLSVAGYLAETRLAVTLTDFTIGLTKSVVFAVAVSVAGCLRGMQAGRSAADVGRATTSAVVTAIVLIIAIDAVFAVLTNALGV